MDWFFWSLNPKARMSGGGRPSFSELMQPRFSIHIPEKIQVRCSKMLHKCVKPNLQFFNLLKLENKSEKWNSKQMDMGLLNFFFQIQTEKNIFPLFLPCHLTAVKWSYFKSTKIDFDRTALIWRFDYYYGFCHGCFFEVEDQYGAANGRNEWSHTVLWHLFVLFYTRNP